MRAAFSCLLSVALGLAPAPPAFAQASGCPSVGGWMVPATGERREGLPAILAAARVVLLGEAHEEAEHHRWQLHSIAALHQRRPDLVLGFEMFPRRVQPVLDRWSRGDLGEADFLREVGWSEVWGFDADLYLPLFHFARMHRLPMRALNVARPTVRAISTRGLAALAPGEREGVGDPAPVSAAYRDRLLQSFREHPGGGQADAESEPFRRFVEAQTFWDRAMAEAIAGPAREGRLVIGIVGQGHVEYRHGVAHQLEALGIDRVVTALPWTAGPECRAPDAQIADAVFGVVPPASPRLPPPRLGVVVSEHEAGVRVDRVMPQSIAETTGLVAGDVISDAAGRPVRRPAELVAVIRRQAPGTHLPLSVRRGEQSHEFLAHFPAEP